MLETDLIQRVFELSGQDVKACFQCGKCSAGCPICFAMDRPPHQIMYLIQLGLEKYIASSKTIWLCSSCFTCTVRCPRGIDVARVMEALRLITLRKNISFIEPLDIPSQAIAKFPQIALVGSFRKLVG